MGSRFDQEHESDVVTQKKKKTKKPRLYKVIFHNDDYTTMEFVVFVLEQVFHKNSSEAAQIMLNVHRQGSGLVGVYTHAVAETKVAQTLELARSEGHPLMVTMEPE